MISATALLRKKRKIGATSVARPDLKSAMAIIEAALLGEKVFTHYSGSFIVEADIKWKKLGLPLTVAQLLKQALEAKGYKVVYNGPTGWEIEDGGTPDHINVLAMGK